MSASQLKQEVCSKKGALCENPPNTQNLEIVLPSDAYRVLEDQAYIVLGGTHKTIG